MDGDCTKERILDVSLGLFAQYGFSAVSIRDICRDVHIKESSVYYHFANKRAILDELRHRFEARASEMMRQMDEAVSGSQTTEAYSGVGVSEIFFREYLMDPFCNQYLRLLYIEQNGSDEMHNLYDKWMFDEPLAFQRKIFGALLGEKVNGTRECEYMALKYYAPVFLNLQRYLLSGELTEEKKILFLKEMEFHTRRFFEEMEGNSWQISL